jgi:hypothetical protein
MRPEIEAIIARASARAASRDGLRAGVDPHDVAPAVSSVPTVSSARAHSASLSTPAGSMAQASTLPPELAEFFPRYDLYDPTAMAKEDQASALGAVGFGSGFALLLPLFEAGLLEHVAFSALIGGGVTGLLALRKDKVGEVTREIVGDTSNKVAAVINEKAIEADERYNVRENVKKTASEQLDKLKTKLKDGI